VKKHTARTVRARTNVYARGMTLIEIMVVVVIISLIGTAVAVNVMGNLEKAKLSRAKTDIGKISEAVDSYKIMKGRYPSTEEGLPAVVKEKLLNANKDGKVTDPWDREYVYLYPGQVHADGFDVKSYGGDGQPGGEGENADITN
jgi:general secretion pathway protein G